MNRRLAVVLALVLVVAPLQGCLSGGPFGGDDGGTDDGSDGSDDGGTDGGTDGGSDGGDAPKPPLPPVDFDGDDAYAHVEEQVKTDSGATQYRVPGTQGAREARRSIIEALGDARWQIQEQSWKGQYVCEPTNLVNVIGILPGRTNQQIILGAHYDTRPWADNDDNFSRTDRRVVGANDGGSGVGALLELADVLADHRPLNYTVKMVFFDAEDGGSPPRHLSDCNPDEDPNHTTPGGWVIGSTRYAAKMSSEERNRTDAVVILDMVGDTNLTLRRERSSSEGPHRPIQDRFYSAAGFLGHEQFVNETGSRVLDDHRPFQRIGIPAIDLIHNDATGDTIFPDTWHTTNDTLEHVSPESLEAAGQVTERGVFALDRALGRS